MGPRGLFLGTLLLVVGCVDADGRPPAPPRDDTIVGPTDPAGDGKELVLALRDATDFVAPGAGVEPALDEMALSPYDLIEPITWSVGGLLARGSDDEVFREPSAPWSVVHGATANPEVSVMLATGDHGARVPAGVGLDAADGYAVWYEGEIFLERGEHRLSLDTAGAAFLEVDIRDLTYRAQTGAGTREPVIVPAEVDRYYPIRIASSHGSGPARFHVFHDPPGDAPPGPLAPIRLRAPALPLAGLLRVAADRPAFADIRGSSLVTGPVLYEKYEGAGPLDLGVTGRDFSQRLAGQLWIDAEGNYDVRVASDGGTRLFIDDALVEDAAFLEPPAVVLAPSNEITPRKLERGWHEIVIDHQARSQPAQLAISLDDGTTNDPMSPLLLRPVITGRQRLVWGSATAVQALPARQEVTLEATNRAQLWDLALSYDLEHPRWDEVTVTLVTPWGAEYVVRDHEAHPDAAARAVATELVDAFDLPSPSPVRLTSGTWALRVEDDAGGGAGVLHGFTVTARYSGGPSAIAPIARYTSSERDLGTPRQVAAVRATGAMPIGTLAHLFVRSCDALPCAGDWTQVTLDMKPLPAARYVQVQAVLYSNGVVPGFIDDIEVWALP